jgi:hypothetical protein
MDRRVLIAVFLVAVGLAVGMAMLLAPSAEPVVAPVEEPAPRTARDARPRPRSEPGRIARPTAEPLQPAGNAAPPVADYDAEDGMPEGPPVKTGPPRSRCMALAVKADIVDTLMGMGSNADLDETERAEILSRIAQIALNIVDETESLHADEQSCGTTSRVDLNHAADFLAEAYPDLELDDDHVAQIKRAVSALDSMDWAEATD